MLHFRAFTVLWKWQAPRTKQVLGFSLTAGMVIGVILASQNLLDGADAGAAATREVRLLSVNLRDLQWIKMEPSLGEDSPLKAIVHEDPTTHSSQFFIKMPRNFRVPLHWHSANETHTVIQGRFTMEASGKTVVLGVGGFNFTPARVSHQGWTLNEEALLFVTIDGTYDLQIGSSVK